MSEIVFDTPAGRSQLIRAMEAAGYHYDENESTPDHLRFFGEGGNVMSLAGWKECEDWLNGVVFDDPAVSDYVETILHPAQIPQGFIPGDSVQNPMRALEDYLEQNDNSFDGILNNMPEPAKTSPALQTSPPAGSSVRDEEERDSVLEQLRRQKEAEYEEKKCAGIFHGKDSEERSLV